MGRWPPPCYQRATALVTDPSHRLLVFDHVDSPEAGTQVPAGGIKPDESHEAAVQRRARRGVRDHIGSGGPSSAGAIMRDDLPRTAVTDLDLKAELHTYLRGARETLVWKLDELGDYDVRRPMAPTGTNLLGLVKHNTATHLRYFGDVFARSAAGVPALKREAPNAEFLVTADETRDQIITNFKRSWEFADETIAALSLDAVGRVPWWGDATVTLGGVLVHVVAETQRHAGHADIIRELIDGAAGLLIGHDNLHIKDAAARSTFFDQVDAEARLASQE